MATYIYPISVSFGAAKSGQIGNVGYRVLSSDGSTLIARTSSGITERTDAAGTANTGTYLAAPVFDSSWGRIRVVWDITGMSGVTAEDVFHLASGVVTLDLTQPIPTSNTAHTLGDSLNAARAQGFGNWRMIGTNLKLYAADGVTVVNEFTLDDATNPMSRTKV